MTDRTVKILALAGTLFSACLFVFSQSCEQRPAAGPSDSDRPPPGVEEPVDASAPEPTRSRENEQQIGGDEPPLGLPPPTEPPGDHRRPSLPPPEKTIPEKIPPGELPQR